MNRLKLYYISDEYVDYLRRFDSKVPYNKNMTRPYVGVVYTFNGHNYFAPLSSPKPKHLNISNKAIDVWKILRGQLGIININNMLPCPIEALKEVMPTVTEKKYKTLLENQISFINSNRDSLLKKINRFYTQYSRGLLPDNVLGRCCDFKLLEEKCKEYTQAREQTSPQKKFASLSDLLASAQGRADRHNESVEDMSRHRHKGDDPR